MLISACGAATIAAPVATQGAAATAIAINKQDIVDIVWQGLAKLAWSVVAPTLGGGVWINPNITDHEFDLGKANQLLEEAGYTLGSDGLREKDGVKLEMHLQSDANWIEYARTADLMKDWFGQIGLKVMPEAVDPDRLTELTIGVGDYDLVIWDWRADPDPDFILSIFTTEQFVVGGWSDSGYANSEYDIVGQWAQGNLGLSWSSGKPVSKILISKLGNTLLLVTLGQVFSMENSHSGA